MRPGRKYIYIYIYPLLGPAGFLGFGHSAKHAHFSFQNSLFSRLFGRSCGVLLCEVRGACFYVVLRVVEIDSEPHPCVIVARNAVHMFIYMLVERESVEIYREKCDLCSSDIDSEPHLCVIVA